MDFSKSNDLKSLLRPYLFVLKEGKEIKENYLDYSLLMLQVNCVETIRSPGGVHAANPLMPSQLEATPQETAHKNLVGGSANI